MDLVWIKTLSLLLRTNISWHFSTTWNLSLVKIDFNDSWVTTVGLFHRDDMKVAKITVLRSSKEIAWLIHHILCSWQRRDGDQIYHKATSLLLAAWGVLEALKWLTVTVLKDKTQTRTHEAILLFWGLQIAVIACWENSYCRWEPYTKATVFPK